MPLKPKTAPTETPITLAEAKEQCRVDDTASDTYLTSLIAVATAYLDGSDGALGKAIFTQTWEQFQDCFSPSIRLELDGVTSIVSIKYYDTDSNLQTVDSNSYTLDAVSYPQWVVLNDGYSWPDPADGINNVIIEFIAGEAEPPEDIKHIIRLMVGHWFENREAVGTVDKELPLGVEVLVNKHRVGWIA